MADKISLGNALDLVMLDPADVSRLLQNLAVANSASEQMSIALHEAAAKVVEPQPDPPVSRSTSEHSMSEGSTRTTSGTHQQPKD